MSFFVLDKYGIPRKKEQNKTKTNDRYKQPTGYKDRELYEILSRGLFCFLHSWGSDKFVDSQIRIANHKNTIHINLSITELTTIVRLTSIKPTEKNS